MKKILASLFLLPLFSSYGETPKPPTTLKGVLLEQLRTTHNQKDWFVPVSVALEGLTPEQASWKDKSGNHSIGQLANHLAFWNSQELTKFKGEKPAAFNGNNEETFNSFDSKSWSATVQKLDRVLTDWEKAVEEADENKLKSWYSAIAHIGTHNAYHTGQIIYIRRLQGSWDASKGVK
jgi:uncharacterized damage-inducible protein DinB